MTDKFSALRSPASSVLILCWPIEPNGAKNGFLKSLDNTPDSLASLLLTSESGAPVSKIRRYGPLPLIFTSTTMCWVLIVSNGTEKDLGCSPACVKAGATTRRRLYARRCGFMDVSHNPRGFRPTA